MINPQQLERYQNDGFLVLEGFAEEYPGVRKISNDENSR